MFNAYIQEMERKRKREGRVGKSERREEKSEKEGLDRALDTGFAWSLRLVGKTTSRGRSSFSMNVLRLHMYTWMYVCVLYDVDLVRTHGATGSTRERERDH